MSAFKDGPLDGRGLLFAGSTSGINLGVAKRFAKLGAKVAVLGRNPQKDARAAQDIGHSASPPKRCRKIEEIAEAAIFCPSRRQPM